MTFKTSANAYGSFYEQCQQVGLTGTVSNADHCIRLSAEKVTPSMKINASLVHRTVPRSNTCSIRRENGPRLHDPGSAAHRTFSRPRMNGYQDDEALKRRTVDASCLADPQKTLQHQLPDLQQMVHPLFSRMANPTDPTLTPCGISRFEHISAPSSFDLAGSISDNAARIAKSLESGCRVIEFSFADAPPEFLVAVISVALFKARGNIAQPPTFVLHGGSEHSRSNISRTWERCRTEAKRSVLPRLERQGSPGFAWIGEDNSSENRLKRQAAAIATLSQGLHCRCKDAMVAGTRFVRSNSTCGGFGSQRIARIWCETGFAMDVALRYARKGESVAVVNAASAFQIGGGFLSGGRHALEEAMCMQSTLFFSLQQASVLAETENLTASGHRIHIPEDGAVLSPYVEVFRDGSAEGYATTSTEQLAAVLSIAMPNKNPRVHANPMCLRSDGEYQRLLEKKFKAVLKGASDAHAKVLVMPDVGCGVFRNDPRVVGKVFGNVLLDSPGQIDKVLLVGSDDFTEAVRRTFSARSS